MQKYQSVVQQPNGDVVPFASVLVRTDPGGVNATLYSDDGVTPVANPLTTDQYGNFAFYATDDIYQLTITRAGFTTANITGIQLNTVQNGVWTPTWAYFGTESPGATYVLRRGVYQKIGGICRVICNMSVGNKGSTTGSGFGVGGLPFPAKAGSFEACAVAYTSQITPGVCDQGAMLAVITAGAQYIQFKKMLAGGSNYSGVADTDVLTNFNVRFTLDYEVA